MIAGRLRDDSSSRLRVFLRGGESCDSKSCDNLLSYARTLSATAEPSFPVGEAGGGEGDCSRAIVAEAVVIANGDGDLVFIAVVAVFGEPAETNVCEGKDSSECSTEELTVRMDSSVVAVLRRLTANKPPFFSARLTPPHAVLVASTVLEATVFRDRDPSEGMRCTTS